MDDELNKYVLDELFPIFESLETQSAAILMFLKDKKIATDKKLAPYLEQAGNASSVKWRAARVRLEHLLSSATHPPQKATERIAKPAEPKESQVRKEPEKPQAPQANAQQPAAQPALQALQPPQASQSELAPAKPPAKTEAKTQDQPQSEAQEKEKHGDASKSAVAPPFSAIGKAARSQPAKPNGEAAERAGKNSVDSAEQQKPASDQRKNATKKSAA
jgi:hypothetical protein